MTVDRTKMSNYDRERASVFHSWSAQNTIKPLMVKSAKGLYVTDEDDNTYLDFSSQLVNVNVGHQQPDVVEAIRSQAAELCTIAPQHGNPARFRAAELILDHSFEGAAKVFFTNGGTEANEHAVRMARLHTGRHKVLARYRSYHGATATSINLTGDPRRWPSDSASAGVVHFFGPFQYRSQFHSDSEEQECERALQHLRSTIEFEVHRPSRPSFSNRFPVPQASWFRPRDTSRAFARSVTSSALSTSPTRLCVALVAPAPGLVTSTAELLPTS